MSLKNLFINGQERKNIKSSSLGELLVELKINSHTVVFEKNGIIIKKEETNQTTLKDGDKIEIIQFLGGG